MLGYLTLLLICQLLGEVIQLATGLPLPGPVIGMAILLVGLIIRGGIPDDLEATAGGLLQHLSLLFVPAGVGVMLYLGQIGDELLPIAAALVVSAVVTLVVTALVMQIGLRLQGTSDEAAE